MSADATLQHIAMLAAKRERLLVAQLEAEAQYLTMIARQYKAGELTEIELAQTYARFRDTSDTKGYSTRWNAAVPVAAGRLARLVKEYPDGHDGATWHGEFPLTAASVAPMGGIPVVYLLFDVENAPCYVGSTGHFRDRLKRHARTGKAFARWSAHACQDRADAYRVEREWLAQHQPYMNKRSA